MQYIKERERAVLPSMCDHTAGMSIAAVLNEYMDIATLHAEELGVGADALARDSMFWLTVKTRVKVLRLPRMMETVTVRTWPEHRNGTRYNRYYSMEKAGEILSEGMTEWSVINTSTGRLVKDLALYPEHVIEDHPAPCSEPFEKFSKDVSDTEHLGEYTVRSTDIDLGGHMNNVAYCRALMSMLTSKEAETLFPGTIELQYRSSIYEGDKVRVLKRSSDSKKEFYFVKEDGSVSFHALITSAGEER